MEFEVGVDSGQIAIIKKDLISKFDSGKKFKLDKEEKYKKKILDNKPLKLNYRDCSIVSLYGNNRVKVTDGLYVFNTADGDGTYKAEINPADTEVSGNFIGFTEESTGFMYTVYNKYEGDDPEEDCSEYVELYETVAEVNIEESGEYYIDDPCYLSSESPLITLEKKSYSICFFENQEEW